MKRREAKNGYLGIRMPVVKKAQLEKAAMEERRPVSDLAFIIIDEWLEARARTKEKKGD